MERKKAVIGSAVVAVGLTLSAGLYIAGSGLLAGATDNVGNLQPAVASPTTTTTMVPPSTKPQEVIVFVDPATGTATTVAPQPSVTPSAVDQPPATTPPVKSPRGDDTGYDDHGDDDHSDDNQVDDHGDDHDDDRSDDRDDSHGGDEGEEDDD